MMLRKCGAKIVSWDTVMSSRAVCDEAPGKACKLSQGKRILQVLGRSQRTERFKQALPAKQGQSRRGIL